MNFESHRYTSSLIGVFWKNINILEGGGSRGRAGYSVLNRIPTWSRSFAASKEVPCPVCWYAASWPSSFPGTFDTPCTGRMCLYWKSGSTDQGLRDPLVTVLGWFEVSMSFQSLTTLTHPGTRSDTPSMCLGLLLIRQGHDSAPRMTPGPEQADYAK